MINAQQFEEGACNFAQLWQTCSNSEHQWTWHASGNRLVCFSHNNISCVSCQHILYPDTAQMKLELQLLSSVCLLEAASIKCDAVSIFISRVLQSRVACCLSGSSDSQICYSHCPTGCWIFAA